MVSTDPIPLETLRRLPKVELHVHLDTSVRPSTVGDLGRRQGIAIPDDLDSALIAPPICNNLADYLTRVDLALQVLQTAEALERVAYELVEDMAAERMVYAEIRYAPQLCIRGGLSMQQVIDAVASGLRAAREDYGVRTGQIICCLRHDPSHLSHEVAQYAIANWAPGKVIGLDLAADEARYGGFPHQTAFRLARGVGMPRTVHAGEAAGAESVREAIELLEAQRIGHGVNLQQDPSLFAPVRVRHITLEMCPTSNVQTRAVRSLADHPIDRYLRNGLPVTVNTDGRTTSNTNLTREFASLAQQFGWGLDRFLQTTLDAAASAFVSPEERDDLRQTILERWPAA
ncbi:MAG TPA: adenosine deaminase [Anaerolineae bacterium]|nr:adenosine deaminase [Anaerolineae bacterium]HNT05514.1 adenosine deaminase [Anaerolineae bacterium]